MNVMFTYFATERATATARQRIRNAGNQASEIKK